MNFTYSLQSSPPPCSLLQNNLSGRSLFSNSKFASVKTKMVVSDGVGKKFTILHGLKDLCQPLRYKVWLLDQFGVLHDGKQPYRGAIETLEQMAGSGAKIVVISNSSRRVESTYKNLEGLGFDSSLFSGVITSGELTHESLQNRRNDSWFANLGRKCLHFTWNKRGLISLKGLNIDVVENPHQADFVLAHGTEALGNSNGGVTHASLDELEAMLAVCASRGIPMVVANPDHVTVEARDLKVMPGTLGLKYERLGGQVQYMGKPYPKIYQAAKEMTGADFSDMMVVGDSLSHDIQGGFQNGIDSVFVACGIHADELGIKQVGQQPAVEMLESLFKSKNIYPTYVVPMFNW